jgi:transposase-like protein
MRGSGIIANFKPANFVATVIPTCVRRSLAYSLSYRHREELVRERGVSIGYATINRWVMRYSPQLEAPFHQPQVRPLNKIVEQDHQDVKRLTRPRTVRASHHDGILTPVDYFASPAPALPSLGWDEGAEVCSGARADARVQARCGFLCPCGMWFAL